MLLADVVRGIHYRKAYMGASGLKASWIVGRPIRAIGLAMAMVASVAGAACSGGDASSAPTSALVAPTTVTASTIDPANSLPALEVSASDVAAWLVGTGAALSEVRRIGLEVLAAQDSFSVAVCQGWVDALAAGETPGQLVDVAGTAPDPVIGDALGGAVIALNRVLSRCISSEPPDGESLGQLESQLLLADEREASL